MSNATTSAGTTLSIGDAMPVVEDAAGYAGAAWDVVGEVDNIPEYGTQYNLVTFNPLGERRTTKRKGSYNTGSLTVTMARYPSDAGQDALQTALSLDTTFPFRVVFQDGSKEYFGAQVFSYTSNVSSVDSITMASVQLEITTDVLKVTAASTG